jgi:hypothetical protein
MRRRISLHPAVAFEWPSASTAQVVVSIRQLADIQRLIGVPSCIFGGQQAQTTTSKETGVFSIGEISHSTSLRFTFPCLANKRRKVVLCPDL